VGRNPVAESVGLLSTYLDKVIACLMMNCC